MPAYRVEASLNNRAGCQDTLCKKNGVKIMKGEIRFGVWVEGQSDGREFQGFKWRHWGCVSGKTLQNIRESLTPPLAEDGQYDWELLDGLEEMPPDYNKKIKLAITEGKIADEDWNGDPEYNVLGKTGIRGRATPKKKDLEGAEDGVNDAAPETPSKAAVKKRGRANDDSDEKEAKPAKKRAIKVMKEDEGEGDSKPKKKHKAESATKDPKKSKRVKKEEDTEFTGVKIEENDQIDVNVKPAKKARGKNNAKAESIDESQIKKERNDDVDIDIKPAKKGRGKKVAKKEEIYEVSYATKEESNGHAEDVELMKKDDDEDVKEKPATTVEETGQVFKAEMPEDPLDQVSMGFCNRSGPLVDEFKGVLQKMHEREVAAKEPAATAPKKGRKGKKLVD